MAPLLTSKMFFAKKAAFSLNMDVSHQPQTFNQNSTIMDIGMKNFNLIMNHGLISVIYNISPEHFKNSLQKTKKTTP